MVINLYCGIGTYFVETCCELHDLTLVRESIILMDLSNLVLKRIERFSTVDL